MVGSCRSGSVAGSKPAVDASSESAPLSSQQQQKYSSNRSHRLDAAAQHNSRHEHDVQQLGRAGAARTRTAKLRTIVGGREGGLLDLATLRQALRGPGGRRRAGGVAAGTHVRLRPTRPQSSDEGGGAAPPRAGVPAAAQRWSEGMLSKGVLSGLQYDQYAGRAQLFRVQGVAKTRMRQAQRPPARMPLAVCSTEKPGLAHLLAAPSATACPDDERDGAGSLSEADCGPGPQAPSLCAKRRRATCCSKNDSAASRSCGRGRRGVEPLERRVSTSLPHRSATESRNSRWPNLRH